MKKKKKLPGLTYDVSELLVLAPEINPEGLKGEWLTRHLLDRIGQWMPTEWQRKSGRVIPIGLLNDDHLANTIRFLIRDASRAKARYVGEWIGTATSETWGPRGEGAQMAVDMESREVCDLTWLDHVRPVFWAVLMEARRRGLPKLTTKELMEYGAEVDAGNLNLELATMKAVLDRDKLIQVKQIIG